MTQESSVLIQPLPMVPIFGTTVVTEHGAPRRDDMVDFFKSAQALVDALAPDAPAPANTDDYDFTPDFAPTPYSPKMR